MKKGHLLGIILSGFIASAYSQEQRLVVDESDVFKKPRYHKHSVGDILNASDSNDPELVKISGEIVRKIKGKIYLFRGETGDIKVVIDDSALPERGIILKSPTVIKGEVANPPDRAPRIEVDNLHYVF